MATIREQIKVKRSLTLFLLNQFKLCSIVNFSLEFKDLSPPLDLKTQCRKEKEKGKHFQNMTEGSMFMTFVRYSVI